MVLRSHPNARAAGEIIPLHSSSAPMICSGVYFLYGVVASRFVSSVMLSFFGGATDGCGSDPSMPFLRVLGRSFAGQAVKLGQVLRCKALVPRVFADPRGEPRK